MIFLKERIEYILNSLPISTKYILILLFSFWKHIQNDLRKSQVEYLTLWINVWDLYDAPRTFWWINFLPQLLIYPVLYRESFRTAWYPMYNVFILIANSIVILLSLYHIEINAYYCKKHVTVIRIPYYCNVFFYSNKRLFWAKMGFRRTER